ncbi:MAG: methyltransferase domain-containing protein [Chloroflexi bacterium]|nr:methyltransferase domain-containing protein [Chloroflexota bacterium]
MREIVLSHFQIALVLQAKRSGKTNVELSPDLGISVTRAELAPDFLYFPDYPQIRLSWAHAEKIARDENACFVLNAEGIHKIKTFSELTHRAYSLYPTRSAPTMLVAGFPMHRIKDSDPLRDTLAKVKTLAPLTGIVLDTATGLGYTAIELSKTAPRVITIELDPAAQEICRANPWSRALFDNPKIERRIGDSFEIVQTFDAMTFDAVLHDPPTMSLAGDLYSLEFYRELFRVLRRGGKLFHYIGDPQSKFGANITRGVTQRLKDAGFQRLKPAPQAFGVVAWK